VNPFAVLGLPEWPDLEDETVRAAWVAIVAETSPDRADGGDPGRFAEACMAYFELNNAWGRSVAYAELVRARAGPFLRGVRVPGRSDTFGIRCV
jgi:hypothetical protein